MAKSRRGNSGAKSPDIEVLTIPGLEELARAVRPESDPGYTVAEIAKAAGVCPRTAQRRIDQLIAVGTCRKGWGYRTDTTGKMQGQAVYEMAK